MNEDKIDNQEKLIDIKGTFVQFVKTDEPELSQEEAIKRYQEPSTSINMRQNKNSNNDSADDGDDITGMTEEQEHLNRIKQELLASLERVKKLEKQVFKEPNLNEKSKLNVKSEKNSAGSKGKGQQEREEEINLYNQKERE